MGTINQITTTEIEEKLSRFESLGGVIEFKFFKLSEPTSEYDAHLLIAQQTLELRRLFY
jgi:hypothetical protein